MKNPRLHGQCEPTTTSQEFGHHTSTRAKLLLVGTSLVAAVTAAELLLRLALPTPIHWRYPQERYLYDREIGITLAPSQQAFTHDRPVQTNSVGIRDQEYPVTAPPSVTRLVALGDSQTFGNGLALEETWPKQLERELNDHFGRGHWEVLNCGVAGTDTWQHEIILRRMLDAYHPHRAILAFYVNDVTARYEIPPMTAAALTNSLPRRFGYLLKESVLLLVLRDATAAVRHRFWPSQGFKTEQAIITGTADVAVERGWGQVNDSLAAMKAISDARGAEFTVVVIPRRDQVTGQEPSRAYQNRLKAILERHRISYVDVLDPLRQAYRDYGRSLFIAWDGHDSAIANRIIAHELRDSVTAPLKQVSVGARQ